MKKQEKKKRGVTVTVSKEAQEIMKKNVLIHKMGKNLREHVNIINKLSAHI